jgi:hypothetical protein
LHQHLGAGGRIESCWTSPGRNPPRDSLRKFARRKKISEDVVVAVFETERLRLSAGAKVERIVDVLAEKRARRALEKG